MSGSCCGGSTKSETPKIATRVAQKTSEGTTEQLATKSEKSECCNDKPSIEEKTGCGC
jgi:hypothetical protein